MIGRSLPTGIGFRAALGMLDQAVLSLGNFVFAAIVARSVAPDAFGAFALAFSVYWITLGVSRAVASEPLVVVYGADDATTLRHHARRGAATAVLVGAVAALGGALFAVLVGGDLGGFLLPVAVGLPAALLQDYCRYVAYVLRRQRAVLALDAAWCALLLVAAVAVRRAGAGDETDLMVVWSACAFVAASAGVAMFGVRPVLGQAVAWVRDNWNLGWRFVVEFTAFNGSSQLALYVIAGVGGLAAAGSIRGAQLLLGPFNVAFMGAGMVLLPGAVTLLARRGPESLERAVRLIATLFALAAVAVGVAIVLLPASVGESILGASWSGAHRVVAPLALALAASGAARGPIIGLRALKAADRSVRVRVLVAPLTVGAAAAGVAAGGALGAAIGLAVAAWIGVLLAWREFGAGTASLRRDPRAHPPETRPRPSAVSP